MSLRRIVIVSRETHVTELAQQVGREIFVADDPNEALEIVETVDPNLILFDYRFSPGHIRDFHELAHKNSIDIPPIVAIGDDEHTDLSLEFKQTGAYD